MKYYFLEKYYIDSSKKKKIEGILLTIIKWNMPYALESSTMYSKEIILFMLQMINSETVILHFFYI